MDKTAAVMRLRYRSEESRLVLWGRFWGLLMLGDDSKIQSSPHNLDDLSSILLASEPESASKSKKEQQAQMINHESLPQRRHSFNSEDSELNHSLVTIDDEYAYEDAESDDDRRQDLAAKVPDLSMKLPLEWFINMTGKIDGFSMESLRLPGDFELRFEHDATPPSDGSSVRAVTPNFVEENVFVEWRNYDDSAADEQLQMALDARQEQVSHLFGRGSKDSNHIVMQCLGYVLPDNSRMGLVFRPPPGFAGPPSSLHELMREDFESASAIVPDLDDRLGLAEKLSTALYQLQFSGWLHRKISSHNVVFFPITMENGEPSFKLSQPRLIGWQTARYDDQVYAQRSEYTSVWRKNKWLPEELPYIHPARPAARARFKRSFDVYALGIVLAEIAFWEPIDVLSGNKKKPLFPYFDQSSDAPELQRFSELVVSTCEKELAGEVGRKYKSAVVWALEGVKSWQAQQAAARTEATKEELGKEIGLERAFFWNVVSQLSAASESRSCWLVVGDKIQSSAHRAVSFLVAGPSQTS
ncbi:hypothetical protein LTS15_008556 [Exophiala xenobiotica]|nr:hypothetical protein LTS15_008556 [Exophiala xenobiotica]